MKNVLKSGNKFNPIIMVFYGLIVAAVGYIIIVSRAAPAPPTMYLNPAINAFAVNTTFTIDVRENSGTTAVNAVQANLSYNATLVDFVSIDQSTSPFTIHAQATGGAGAVTIASGTAAGGAPVTGDQIVATITFKTKTTNGTANMAFTSGTSLVSSTTNQDILGSLAATAGGGYVVDAQAPTVSINSPANGATIAGGSTTTIGVTASDNTTVSKVDILIDGNVKTTLTASPFNYSWNTSGVVLGSHTIQAKAYDPYGNTAMSTVTNVTLADQTPPTVSITQPTGGSSLSGTQTVNVNASDNAGGTGMSKVEFYVDGVLKGTDTTSPFSFSWDTKTATDAPHTLTAKAYDSATPANVSTSAAVSVTVDNADHTPPSTPGNFTSTGQTTSSISLSWSASTDNVGVTGYRLQRNGSTISTSTSLTHNDTNLTAGTSYTYTVVALDANNNTSTAATLTVSTKAKIIGDTNGDGKVDVIDLSTLLSNWGTNNPNCDFNNNGTVDIFDLSALLSHYT